MIYYIPATHFRGDPIEFIFRPLREKKSITAREINGQNEKLWIKSLLSYIPRVPFKKIVKCETAFKK